VAVAAVEQQPEALQEPVAVGLAGREITMVRLLRQTLVAVAEGLRAWSVGQTLAVMVGRVLS
jgi:hypothetical protein